MQRGFTLIEALIVMAILSVLSAAAAPALSGLVARMRADAAIQALTVDLALSRVAAISHGQAVTACPSSDAERCNGGIDWTTGWLVFVDANRNRRIDTGEQVLSTQEARRVSGLTFQSTDGRTSLRYLPTGFSHGSNVTMTACLRGRVHAWLVMNNAGRVRVERPRPAPACTVPAE